MRVFRTRWLEFERRHLFCIGRGYVHVGPIVIEWRR